MSRWTRAMGKLAHVALFQAFAGAMGPLDQTRGRRHRCQRLKKAFRRRKKEPSSVPKDPVSEETSAPSGSPSTEESAMARPSALLRSNSPSARQTPIRADSNSPRVLSVSPDRESSIKRFSNPHLHDERGIARLSRPSVSAATNGALLAHKNDKHLENSAKNANPESKALSSGSENDSWKFNYVHMSINFEKMETVALMAHGRCWNSHKGPNPYAQYPEDLEVDIDQNHKCGSYNMVLTTTFTDGTKWMARFPGHGIGFGPLDKVKMETEYQTMRYVKQQTTIPIPEVYHWETDSGSIGSAFAFIQYLPGRPLYLMWDDANAALRQKILQQIASFMAQLQNIRYDKLGALSFDKFGAVVGIESRVILTDNTWFAWGSPRVQGPYFTLQEDLTDNEHASEGAEYCAMAVSSILRLAVESIPASIVPHTGASNALAMPDLDMQNILVDDEGTITGLIDWDGASTMPMSLGCAAYPLWLMQDWRIVPKLPVKALAIIDSHRQKEYEENRKASEELSGYRKMYAELYEEVMREKGVPDYNPQMTRCSHILTAIKLANNNRNSRGFILQRLLEYAFEDGVPFTVAEYEEALEDGYAASMDREMKEAFASMWNRPLESSDSCDEQIDLGSSDGAGQKDDTNPEYAEEGKPHETEVHSPCSQMKLGTQKTTVDKEEPENDVQGDIPDNTENNLRSLDQNGLSEDKSGEGEHKAQVGGEHKSKGPSDHREVSSSGTEECSHVNVGADGDQSADDKADDTSHEEQRKDPKYFRKWAKQMRGSLTGGIWKKRQIHDLQRVESTLVTTGRNGKARLNGKHEPEDSGLCLEYDMDSQKPVMECSHGKRHVGHVCRQQIQGHVDVGCSLSEMMPQGWMMDDAMMNMG